MAKTISNDGELNDIMENAARSLMQDISEEILAIFTDEYVRKYAYVYGPTKYHNPKGQEFLNAWEWTEIQRMADTLVTTMFNNPEKMTVGVRDGRYIHSSYTGSWPEDTREMLPEYLDGMPISKIIHPGDRAGGYWTRFMKSFYNTSKMKRLIRKHAKKYGFVEVSVLAQ